MSQTQPVEIVLGHCRRTIGLPKSYAELLQKSKDLYGDSLPQAFKFFYRDAEGDLISVSSQDDYEIAYAEANSTGFELIIFPNLRSSKNSPRGVRPPCYSFADRTRNATYCNIYEALHNENNDAPFYQAKALIEVNASSKIPLEESKEIAIEKSPVATVATATGTKFGPRCATYTQLPDDSSYTMVANEDSLKIEVSGSQEIKKDLCISQTDLVECLSCGGRKLNKKGSPCKKCNGSGKMNAALKRHVERIIKREVERAVQTEVAKQQQHAQCEKRKELIKETTCTFCTKGYNRRENIHNANKQSGCDIGLANCGGCCIF